MEEHDLLLEQLCSPPRRRCILLCSSSCSLVVVDVAEAGLVDAVAFASAVAALAEDTVPVSAVVGRVFERRESLV